MGGGVPGGPVRSASLPPYVSAGAGSDLTVENLRGRGAAIDLRSWLDESGADREVDP
jgi:hypothetical protein